jgi:hypothetical protein
VDVEGTTDDVAPASPIGADFDMIDLDNPQPAPQPEFSTPERRSAQAADVAATPPAPSPSSVTPSPQTPATKSAAAAVEMKLHTNSAADWWTAARDQADAAPAAALAADAVSGAAPDLPLDAQNRLAMYWIDAAEEGNSLFLFGKVACSLRSQVRDRCVLSRVRRTVDSQRRSLGQLLRRCARSGAQHLCPAPRLSSRQCGPVVGVFVLSAKHRA